MNSIKNLLLPIMMIALLEATAADSRTRTCYTCNGINCLRTTLNITESCIDSLDYCVTIFDKFNVIRRGCSLNTPIEMRRRCDMNTVECHKCNTDKCNNLGQADFRCIQCDSSKDENCAENAQMISPSRCNVPTSMNSYCFTKYENNITKRGCSISAMEQRKCFEDGNCMLCLPGDINGCNSVDFMKGSRAWML